MQNSVEKYRIPRRTFLGMFLYFMVPFPGYQLLLKFFLDQDPLPFKYILVPAIFGLLVFILMERLTKGKTIKRKVFAGLLLLIVVIMINWIVRFI